MPYIRKMKDGSEKVYHTWEEVNKGLEKRIKDDAEELRIEFRKHKSKQKNIGFSTKIAYV